MEKITRTDEEWRAELSPEAYQVTRHAEVTRLELDPTIFDSAFELKLPADTRKVY